MTDSRKLPAYDPRLYLTQSERYLLELEREDKLFRMSDWTLDDWVHYYCVHCWNSNVKPSELYAVYLSWALKNKIQPQKIEACNQWWVNVLRNRGFEKGRKSNQVYWMNIAVRIAPDSDELLEVDDFGNILTPDSSGGILGYRWPA